MWFLTQGGLRPRIILTKDKENRWMDDMEKLYAMTQMRVRAVSQPVSLNKIFPFQPDSLKTIEGSEGSKLDMIRVNG